MKGGYQLIDCHGANLHEDGITIDGIFKAIDRNHGKNIILTNFILLGVLCADTAIECQFSGSVYSIPYFFGKKIIINANDLLTVSDLGYVNESQMESAIEAAIENVQIEGVNILSTNADAGDVISSNGEGGSEWISLDGKFVRKMGAPDPENLTDSEIELIKNGVFVNGTLLGFKNPLFFPAGVEDDTRAGGLVIVPAGGYEGVGSIRSYSINKTTKHLIIRTDGRGIYFNGGGSDVTISGATMSVSMTNGSIGGTASFVLSGVTKFNTKVVPPYPSSTGTFTLKSVDGVLTWVQDV